MQVSRPKDRPVTLLPSLLMSCSLCSILVRFYFHPLAPPSFFQTCVSIFDACPPSIWVHVLSCRDWVVSVPKYLNYRVAVEEEGACVYRMQVRSQHVRCGAIVSFFVSQRVPRLSIVSSVRDYLDKEAAEAVEAAESTEAPAALDDKGTRGRRRREGCAGQGYRG